MQTGARPRTRTGTCTIGWPRGVEIDGVKFRRAPPYTDLWGAYDREAV